MHRRLGSLSGRSIINNLTTPDPPAGRPAGRAWGEDDDDEEEALYQRASDGESDDSSCSRRVCRLFGAGGCLGWIPDFWGMGYAEVMRYKQGEGMHSDPI